MNTSTTSIPKTADGQEPAAPLPAGAEPTAPVVSPIAAVPTPRLGPPRIVALVAASVALSLVASLVARLLARSNQAQMRPLVGDQSAVIALPFSAGIVVNNVTPARRWGLPLRPGRPQRASAMRPGPALRFPRRARRPAIVARGR